MSPIDQLCPQCGLCCDSTLFADVELRAGDDVRRLAQAGIETWLKTKTRQAFSQPCACFDGQLCKAYAERPNRCRLFACGLLKRVDSGEMTAAAALQKISQARTKTSQVRTLVRQSGQSDESMALTHRYEQAMCAPVDLSVDGAADLRGELMLAVNDLMQLLERDFLR